MTNWILVSVDDESVRFVPGYYCRRPLVQLMRRSGAIDRERGMGLGDLGRRICVVQEEALAISAWTEENYLATMRESDVLTQHLTVVDEHDMSLITASSDQIQVDGGWISALDGYKQRVARPQLQRFVEFCRASKGFCALNDLTSRDRDV